jgi:hypothetical protein
MAPGGNSGASRPLSEGAMEPGHPLRRASDYPQPPPAPPPPLSPFERFTQSAEIARFFYGVLKGVVVLVIVGAVGWLTLGDRVNEAGRTLTRLDPEVTRIRHELDTAQFDITRIKSDLEAIEKQATAARGNAETRRESDEKDRREMERNIGAIKGNVDVLEERVRGALERAPPLPLTVPTGRGGRP